MPRSLVIGNGSVFAAFDSHMQMRDFYYPYVGMEDHTMYQHVHRTGVYVEGKGFAWFNDESWDIKPGYLSETLLGDSVLRNEKLGIEILMQDYVHPVHNIIMRTCTVRNLNNKEDAKVKMFFHHDLHIYGDKQKDTAFYEPHTNTVIHYRAARYFLVGGHSSHPTECITGVHTDRNTSILKAMQQLKTCGLSSYAIGKSDYKGMEGTWRDAEDGELHRNEVEQGSVDSTVGIYSHIPAGEVATVSMWLCAGQKLDEVLNLHNTVVEESPERLERNCRNYWKSWVNKEHRDFGTLTKEQVDLYKRSLLTIRLHCDNHGGIIAAADADIMAFNKDTYTYVWPRDGAFVSLALDRAGYGEVTRRFFEFCIDLQMPDGYMLHKYNPDGSLGSSWHPWYRDGAAQLPIQEDETALVLYALWQHFERNQDFEFIQHLYEDLLKKAAQFLVDFTEPETGLPLASYDPWEEQRGVFTYTTACTIAGLHAAAKISHVLGHHKHSERYQHAADRMKQAMLFHLYDETEKIFVKKIERQDGKTVHKDATPDISTCVIWKLGVLPIDDPRVISSMSQMLQKLKVQTSIGGLCRYTNDYYHINQDPTEEVPGNPWIITTLWGMQWRIAIAQSLQELENVKETFNWVLGHATRTGILAEQMDAHTGEPLSVAPLTWSHATYVETILLFLEKQRELQARAS